MLFRERRQTVIYVAAAIMVGGFVLFRYLPLRGKMRMTQQVKAAQTFAIVKASVESKQLPVLKEQLLKLQNRVANYELNLPAQRDIGAFLHEVADLMNEHNLKEQAVVLSDTKIEAGGLRCIPIDIQCKGKLAQLFEFYKQLQELDRLVRIERIELVNDSDFSGEVSMHTKVVIYYRPEVKQG